MQIGHVFIDTSVKWAGMMIGTRNVLIPRAICFLNGTLHSCMYQSCGIYSFLYSFNYVFHQPLKTLNKIQDVIFVINGSSTRYETMKRIKVFFKIKNKFFHSLWFSHV